MNSNILDSVVWLNLHSSILILFLSIIMFIFIGKEYKYIKDLKNGRKQLFIALLGIFIIMILQSLNFIFSYFLSDCQDSSVYLFGLAINIMEIIVIGNFISTKWKLLVNKSNNKKDIKI